MWFPKEMAPCGDYCRVDDIPKPACYPTGLHIQDFASNLAVKPSLSRSPWYMPDRSMLLRTTLASCLLTCEMPLTLFSGYSWCMFWSRLGYMYVLVTCSSPAKNLQHLQALLHHYGGRPTLHWVGAVLEQFIVGQWKPTFQWIWVLWIS